MFGRRAQAINGEHTGADQWKRMLVETKRSADAVPTLHRLDWSSSIAFMRAIDIESSSNGNVRFKPGISVAEIRILRENARAELSVNIVQQGYLGLRPISFFIEDSRRGNV